MFDSWVCFGKYMKRLLFILFAFLVTTSYAQKFEGKIDVVKKTLSDTVYYSYSIKKTNIRVDQFDKNKRLQRSYIINLQDSSMFAINHSAKLYTQVAVDTTTKKTKSSVEVINTGIFKYINGYKCYQWRVKDVSKNTEVAYWVAGENFDFFAPMASIWKNVDSDYLYFLALPITSTPGQMPLLTEHRTLMRDNKASYAVTEIEKSVVKEETFTIPKNFSKIQTIR